MTDLTKSMNTQAQRLQLPDGELTVYDASKFINSVVSAKGATALNGDDAKRVFDFVDGLALKPQLKFPLRGETKKFKQATFLQAQCYQHSIGVERDIQVAAMQYIKVLSAGYRQAPAARNALLELNREFLDIMELKADELAEVKSTPLGNDFLKANLQKIDFETASMWSNNIFQALKDNPVRQLRTV